VAAFDVFTALTFAQMNYHEPLRKVIDLFS
jgi:hypothetical protein